MAEANIGLWETLQEKIPGSWRLFALARKMHADKALDKIQFKWPIYDVWRDFQNRESKRFYRDQKDMLLGPVEQPVVQGLERNGISIIHFDDLFPDGAFSDLQNLAESYLK